MGLSIVGIKLIEEAIDKEMFVGMMADGKIALGNDTGAEVIIKAYKSDKVSDIYERLNGRTKRQYKPKPQIIKNNYYNKNYYNNYGSTDDSCVARGVRLASAPNRYT